MEPFFINCDWGTTHFRLRAVRTAGVEIVAEVRSDEGVARVAAATDEPARALGFRTALTAGLEQLAARHEGLGGAPVFISGMASSSIGWQELPYAELPLGLDGAGLVAQELAPISVRGNRHRVTLISGVRTATDVMRGEETQAIGAFQLPSLAAARTRSLVILPGTHSKHLQVTFSRIETFQTFMTGELFDVLCHHSILRHSIGGNAAPVDKHAEEQLEALREGVDHSAGRPLSAAMFRVRTRQLLDGDSEAQNRAFLSGVLLGCELGYLRNETTGDRALVLCAGDALRDHYVAALDHLGLSDRLAVVSSQDFDRLSALGQAVLARKLGGEL